MARGGGLTKHAPHAHLPPFSSSLSGGGYACFAGKEVARALATMSLDAAVVGSADVSDCDAKQLTTLADWETKLSAKYPAVGRVVPPVRLTLAELAAYDGTDKKKPMYIAISGDIYDVTAGKDFYGPDGIYPFAGHECARAFALVSTDVADCVADVSGLAPLELDNLREWKAKFDFKYSKVREGGRGEREGGKSARGRRRRGRRLAWIPRRRGARADVRSVDRCLGQFTRRRLEVVCARRSRRRAGSGALRRRRCAVCRAAHVPIRIDA